MPLPPSQESSCTAPSPEPRPESWPGCWPRSRSPSRCARTRTTWRLLGTSPATGSTSAWRRPRRRWTPGCAPRRSSPSASTSPATAGAAAPSRTSRRAGSRPSCARAGGCCPITLGPQASCHPSFPRYDDDKAINPKPGDSGTYRRARRQARVEATTAVAAAQRLGIVAKSTLWYDLEGFDVTNRHCRESALAFLSAWTTRLHALGYVSGVYSSAGSGHQDAGRRPGQPARRGRRCPTGSGSPAGTARPTPGPTTSATTAGCPGGRMKQYQGGHNETWGGVTINIDRNWLDLGKGSCRPAAWPTATASTSTTRLQGAHDGDHRGRRWSRRCSASSRRRACTAAGCTASTTRGRSRPRSGGRPTTASRPARTWTRVHWMSLLADGASPVLKFGSAGEDVRRVQRALKAASATLKLRITGRYTRATARGRAGLAVRRRPHRLRHRHRPLVEGAAGRQALTPGPRLGEAPGPPAR